MRPRKRLKTILATLCIGFSTLYAQEMSWLDEIMNLPAIAVPIVQYAPETQWVFGGAAQGYFKCANQRKTSVIQLNGAYSLARQWYIKTKGNIYFGNTHNWQIAYEAGYRNYPDTWYETGNDFLIKDGTSFISRRFNLNLQPQYYISDNWSVGLNLNVYTETTTLKDPLNSARSAYMGIGGTIQYDSRDITFYPNSGVFFSLSCSDYEPLNSNFDRMAYLTADLRHFVCIYKNFVFAWQCKIQGAWGGKRLPYSLLPTLGGEDLLRGLRANMYKDNTLWALQGELRFPIYSIVHGTAFAGMGDVYDIHNWQWAAPKVSYGIGLRVSINKAKVNLRADVARSNLDNRWNTIDAYSFYLTATEAF